MHLISHDHHVRNRHRDPADRIGDDLPLALLASHDPAHHALGRAGPAAAEQRHEVHRRENHPTGDDLLAATHQADAGHDMELARRGPACDVGDVAAPTGRDFLKGVVNAGRQSHDRSSSHEPRTGRTHTACSPCRGRHGLSDRAQRHERRRGAFGQSDWCTDRPVMLLVEGCSPQGCTLTLASIRSKGADRLKLWIITNKRMSDSPAAGSWSTLALLSEG